MGQNSEYSVAVFPLPFKRAIRCRYFSVVLPCRKEGPHAILRPNAALGQLAQNMTIYSVALAYRFKYVDYMHSVPDLCVPEDKTAPIPSPPTVGQYVSNRYYVYTCRLLIHMLNNTTLETTLCSVAESLTTLGGASPLDVTAAPYFGLAAPN